MQLNKKLLAGAVGTALSAWLLSNLASATTSGPLAQYVPQVQKDMIVVLRDQMPSLPPVRRALGARATALMGAQRRVFASMAQLQDRRLKHFSTINAFATRLTADEAAALATHPDVQAVVNDVVIALPKSATRSAPTASSAAVATANPLCNTLEPEALQLLQVAYPDASTPQAQTLRDGRGQPVTGKGVKVAFIADGIDTSIQGFIHTDGSPVFIDEKDFSGDPAGTPTGGAEAFLDASAIAAQDTPNGKTLQFDLSGFVNAAHPLPKGCNIRIRGVAPGASLVGLKAFGMTGAPTSAIVQAIEYAVTQADVDVINESFGSNTYPSITDNPIELANEAAVRAGVVITASTGDAGYNGTLSTEAERAAVISVGASTSYRAYAQVSDGIMPLLKKPAWLSNNVANISSGGVAQGAPKVLDVVAPGDQNWALCSTNTALFTECLDFSNPGRASPIELEGGTSQSSPYTAGVAALVIQAYRSTHGGQDPSPALVKSLIMSTATDLGASPAEQGAGLVNAYAAVNAALSVGVAHANQRGSGLLLSPTSAGVEALPDSAHVRTFQVTNTGNTVKHLAPSLEALVNRVAGERLTLSVDPNTEPVFLNVFGVRRAYVTRTFKVPEHVDHLDAAIGFRETLGDLANTGGRVLYFALIDPAGRQAGAPTPQGPGTGYDHIDVVNPQAGTWTVVVYTQNPAVATHYQGPVVFSWSAERFAKVGNVYPSKVDLQPGASTWLTAQFDMPAAAGDLSAAVKFAALGGSDTYPAIPVTLRTLVPIKASGGSFEGQITGSNGRGAADTQTFAFDVPAGHGDMALTVKVNDPGYLLQGVLVDPNGMPLSVQPNLDPVDGTQTAVLDLHRYSPQPGRWHFLLMETILSSGRQTELPFSAQVKFDGARISAPGLPDDARVKLSASKPTTVAVKVTNNTPVRQLYFADARLPVLSLQQLQPQQCSLQTMLPGACGLWQVPTQSSAAAFLAQSNQPIQMDAYNSNGFLNFTNNPDVWAKPVAKDTVAATLIEPEVPYSYWVAAPGLIGPYKSSGTPTAPVVFAAYALAKEFDAAVAADSGDLWVDVMQNTTTFNPLVLDPGQSGVINLTITPDATHVGDVSSGSIFIDTWNPNVTYGDEVVQLPYRYTVAP